MVSNGVALRRVSNVVRLNHPVMSLSATKPRLTQILTQTTLTPLLTLTLTELGREKCPNGELSRGTVRFPPFIATACEKNDEFWIKFNWTAIPSTLVWETDSPPWTIPLVHFPLPCSVRVRARSGVSRVTVRVGSAKLELRLVGLVLGLGLGLWFGLGEEECLGGENVQGMSDTRWYKGNDRP